MTRLRKIRAAPIVCAATLVCLLTLGAPRASADDIFTLGSPNAALSPYPGPYVQVDVSLTSSTTATITFTSLTASSALCGGTCIYLMGDGGSAAVNVNATSFTVGSITGTNGGTGFTPGPFSTSSGTEDGFGNFNLHIDDFDGASHAVDTLTFTITDTSGTWASAFAVLANNAAGNSAAAHIFVFSSPANAGAGALATGYASQSTPAVPEPASMGLLGTALLGAYGLLRRKLLA